MGGQTANGSQRCKVLIKPAHFPTCVTGMSDLKRCQFTCGIYVNFLSLSIVILGGIINLGVYVSMLGLAFPILYHSCVSKGAPLFGNLVI